MFDDDDCLYTWLSCLSCDSMALLCSYISVCALNRPPGSYIMPGMISMATVVSSSVVTISSDVTAVPSHLARIPEFCYPELPTPIDTAERRKLAAAPALQVSYISRQVEATKLITAYVTCM